jgi:triphosphoribosyl-dephospho-CoA synthetase
MSNRNKAKFLHERFKEQEREIQRLKQQVELQALEKEEDRAQLAATIRASVMKEVQAMFAQNSNQGILSQVSIHLFCLMLDNMTINI